MKLTTFSLLERSFSSLQDGAVPMPERRPSISSLKTANELDGHADDNLNSSRRSFLGKFFSSSRSSDVFTLLTTDDDDECDGDSISSFDSFSTDTVKTVVKARTTISSTLTKPTLVRESGTFNLPEGETPKRPSKSPNKLLELPNPIRVLDRTESNLSPGSTHSSVSILKTSSNSSCLQFDIQRTCEVIDRALSIVGMTEPTNNVQPSKRTPVSRTRRVPVRTKSTLSLDESQHVVLVTSNTGSRHLELNLVRQ